jgi:hypothetical protein
MKIHAKTRKNFLLVIISDHRKLLTKEPSRTTAKKRGSYIWTYVWESQEYKCILLSVYLYLYVWVWVGMYNGGDNIPLFVF